MKYSELSSIRLVRLILKYKDAGAIEVFFSRFNDMIIQVCKRENKKFTYNIDIKEYSSFVQGWIYDNNKLNSLMNRFLLEKDSGSIDDEEIFVKAYLHRILSSGFRAFLRDSFSEYRNRKAEYDESSLVIRDGDTRHYIGEDESIVEMDSNPFQIIEFQYGQYSKEEKATSEYLADYEKSQTYLKKLISYLDTLQPEKRIPLWLTSLVRFMDLPEKDVSWLAEINDCTEGEVNEMIRTFVELNQGKSFCISSENIGKLMHENKNTVSVRKRRLLTELQNALMGKMEPL